MFKPTNKGSLVENKLGHLDPDCRFMFRSFWTTGAQEEKCVLVPSPCMDLGDHPRTTEALGRHPELLPVVSGSQGAALKPPPGPGLRPQGGLSKLPPGDFRHRRHSCVLLQAGAESFATAPHHRLLRDIPVTPSKVRSALGAEGARWGWGGWGNRRARGVCTCVSSWPDVVVRRASS